MRVDASLLNSINLRAASQPYSTCTYGKEYVRRYLPGDVLRVQLTTQFSEIRDYKAQLLNAQGAPVAGGVAVYTSIRDGDIYVLDILVSGLSVGGYSLKVQLKGSHDRYVILQSEPFCIVEDMGEESVLVEVLNSGSAFGVFFDTVSQPFSFRFEGGFYPKSLNLDSNDTMFEGQQAAFDMLYSMPYETQRLLLGGKWGIPDDLAKKMNRAFSCDQLALDGIPYGKADGAKFEAVEADSYPFRSWAINVKEKGDPFGYSSEEGSEVVATSTWGGFVCLVAPMENVNVEGNTGDAAGSVLTVDKKVGGASLMGYPKPYSILDNFDNNGAISAYQFARLSEFDMSLRYNYFYAYVRSLEQISSIPPAYEYEVAYCPLPTVNVLTDDILDYIVANNDILTQ